MRPLMDAGRVRLSWPQSATLPLLAGENPSEISSSVVLPAPFFPSTPMTLPAATFAEMSLSTCLESNDLPTLRAARIDSVMSPSPIFS